MDWPAEQYQISDQQRQRLRKLVSDLTSAKESVAQQSVDRLAQFTDDITMADEALRELSESLYLGSFKTSQSRFYLIKTLNKLRRPPPSLKHVIQSQIDSGVHLSLDRLTPHNPLADPPLVELLGDPDDRVRMFAYASAAELAAFCQAKSVREWIGSRVDKTVSPSAKEHVSTELELLNDAERIGIRFPYFYSSSTLKRLVAVDDSKALPLAVLLVSSTDFLKPQNIRRSVPFFRLNGPVEDLQREGYSVVVREIDSACQMQTALNSVSTYGPISMLMIAVHGSQHLLEFDSDQDKSCMHEGVEKMRKAESWKDFSVGSQVVLI
jgi:hypothetical protein